MRTPTLPKFVMFFLVVATLFTLFLLMTRREGNDTSVRIIMTAQGFEPNELHIAKNTVVAFINTDTQERWPASDIHPTHLLYPEFDSRSPIASGQSWQMTFRKAGTYKFHDHLFPHSRGSIQVLADTQGQSSATTQKSNVLKKVTSSFTMVLGEMLYPFRHAFDKKEEQADVATTTPFTSLNEQQQFRYLNAYLAKNGSQATWQYVQDVFKNEAGNAGNIHDLAHYTGSIIYQKDGMSGLSICTPDFSFGCFHGFLDSVFRNDLSKIGDAVDGCAKLGTQTTGPYSSCIHGIGHGIASFYVTHDLISSLKTCDNIPNGAQYCHDGVFMEFSRSAAKTFYKADDLLYPCNAVDQVYVAACGRNQPSVLFGRFQKSVKEAAATCIEAPDEAFRSSCIDAIGFVAASRSFGDSNKILADCKTIEDEPYQARCAEKAAGELIFQNHPNWRQASFTVCAQLTESYKLSCKQYLEIVIREYGRN